MDEPRLQEPLSSKNRVVQFGAFELFLDTGELRKHGVRIKLQGKPFQILSALLEEPGRVVTRDELRTRLWPADMFVDFESGLNSAINRLRIALGDSAEHPIYVETMARMGYRFIAPATSTPVHQQAAPHQIQEVPKPVLATAAAGPASVVALKPSLQSTRVLPGRSAVAVLLGLLVLTAGALLLVLSRAHPSPSFRQVTFRKGYVESARFTPGGESIVYSAQWSGTPSRLFLANTVSPEARDLGFENVILAGLSAKTEMALFVKPSGTNRYVLEDAPLHGGSPRLISDHAVDADWAPDGTLCEVYEKDGASRIEYPPGRTIHSSNAKIANVRVSPAGDRIAFWEHLIPNDDSGQVTVVNAKGEATILSAGWGSAFGLAWNPSGKEVWFTAAKTGVDRALMAVDLHGALRQISQVPGNLALQDVSSSGKVLIARTMQRMSMFFGDLKKNSERDVSWLDWSCATAISKDGKVVLFDESGEGGGQKYSTYLYRAETQTPERIGEGRSMDLSSDGRWVLTRAAYDLTKLTLVSVDTDFRKAISTPGVEYRWAKFFNDGSEFLFLSNPPNQSAQIYRQKLPDGRPTLVKSGLHLDWVVIDDAGRFAVGVGSDSKIIVLDLASGNTRSVPTSELVSPISFVDDRLILTRTHDHGSILLKFLDLTTGQLTLYRRIDALDPAGIETVFPLQMARDLQTYAYSRLQSLSDLFVVSGWS